MNTYQSSQEYAASEDWNLTITSTKFIYSRNLDVNKLKEFRPCYFSQNLKSVKHPVLASMDCGDVFCETVECENGDQIQKPEVTRDFSWTNSAVKAFLIHRESMSAKFENSSKTKLALYKRIAKKLQKEGFCVQGYDCKKKFDNLTITYNKHKDHRLKTGRERKEWPYFEQMDAILGKKISVNPPPEYLAATTPSSRDESAQTPVPSLQTKKPKKDSVAFKAFAELKELRENQMTELISTYKEVETARTERLVAAEKERTEKLLQIEERKLALLEALLSTKKI